MADKTVNKPDLVQDLMQICAGDLASKAAAGRVLSGVFQAVKNELAAGNRVRIDRFGTFESVDVPARTGVDPNTHEKIELPATRRVRFRASGSLKEAVLGEAEG